MCSGSMWNFGCLEGLNFPLYIYIYTLKLQNTQRFHLGNVRWKLINDILQRSSWAKWENSAMYVLITVFMKKINMVNPISSQLF